jgi:amidase
VLDAIAGYEVGDATWVPRPDSSYCLAIERPPRQLRIAATAQNPIGVPVGSAEVDAVRETAEVLAGLGHRVEEVDPEFPPPEVLGVFMAVYVAFRAQDLADAVAIAGREPDEGEIEPLTRAVDELARSASSVDHLRNVAELQAHSRRMIAFFADWDLLLTPALAERALPTATCHGAMDDPLSALGRSAQFAPYAALFNVTGQPAIGVPAGLGPDGLPTGVQIAGPPLSEDTLLQVAAQLELVQPWAELRPPAPQPGAAA